MNLRTIVILILFWTSSGLAQNNGWTLSLKNGEQMTNILPYKLDQGSLVLLQDGPFDYIPINDIVEIRVNRTGSGGTFRTVLEWGAIGVLAGTITAILTDKIGRANRPAPTPSRPGALLNDNIEFGAGANALAGGMVGGLVGIIVGGVVYNRQPTGARVYSFEALSDKKKQSCLGSF